MQHKPKSLGALRLQFDLKTSYLKLKSVAVELKALARTRQVRKLVRMSRF